MRTTFSTVAILACSLAGCTASSKAREEAEKARAAAAAENAALKEQIADLKVQMAALRGGGGQQPVAKQKWEYATLYFEAPIPPERMSLAIWTTGKKTMRRDADKDQPD